ncbi:MAG: hypothetical protein AAGH88_15280 [Planctomycetota bacterium]
MKTATWFLLCFIGLSLIPGCSEDSSGDYVESPEEIAGYEQALDDVVQWNKDLNQVLASITDAQSLRASIPELEKLGDRYNQGA